MPHPVTSDAQLLDVGEPSPVAVAGYLRQDEAQRLAYLAARVLPRYPMLEIGALRGRSACYMGLAAKQGKRARLWSIDKWGIDEHDEEKRRKALHNRQCFDANLLRFGLERTVTGIRADAREIARCWAYRLGLLFIDGDHSAEGVRADYDDFAWHLRRNGWLAIHDYGPGWDGICDVVDQHILPTGRWDQVTVRHTLLTMRRKVG
jgi:predicted O-methyltransferase YrrM